MKNKAFFRHLKMFLADHIWIILLFLTAPVGFLSVNLLFLKEDAGDVGYYVFLSLFVLACFLAYRLYTTWALYEIFCGEREHIEDFLIGEPRGSEERHYKELAADFERIHLGKLAELEDKSRENKVMIYRWVHQLKTPLSVMKLIAENNKNSSDYKKMAQSVAQMQYDLDQVLNMYKLDAVKNDFHVEKVSLYEVAKSCINELKGTFITRGVYPKLDVGKELMVYSDSKWLKFVLYQLLTNAVKYSDEGRHVTVSGACRDNRITLCVADEGCGIESGDMDRIFDLFFTGQNGRLRGESSGLGLYMTKQILDYLGHPIQVQSAPGEGSVFTIVFELR